MLQNVKETLFKLWGDLEEQKSAMLLQTASRAKSKRGKVLPESSAPIDLSSDDESTDPRQRINRLPPDNSDEENEGMSRPKPNLKSKKSALAERDVNLRGNKEGEEIKVELLKIKPKNKAFECCIKQYGIRVSEEDPEKADAGEGKRWQRVFGLFGTLIK